MELSQVKFLGISDEQDVCDCCGRKGLKRTVALHVIATGQDVFFGTTCAARALSIGAKEVKAAAEAADRSRIDAKRAEYARQLKAEDERFQTWLNIAVPSLADNRFRQLEALGGWTAANSAYKAAAA